MCSLALVVHSSGEGDIPLGLASLAGIGVICGAATVLLTVKFGSRTIENSRRQAYRANPLLVAMNYLFEPEADWVDREPHFTARFGKVFEGCRGGVQWFAAYEAWYAVAGGVIVGTMPSNSAVCSGLLFATTGLAFMYVVLLVAFRPYAARADRCVALLNGLLNLAASAEALANADDAVVAATNNASQAVSLASVVLTVLRAALVYLVDARLPGWRKRAALRLSAIWHFHG